MKIYKPKMYCEPLTVRRRNKELINSFYIKRESDYEQYLEQNVVKGLERYLKYCAWEEDLKNETRIYLIKTYMREEIVAYFALKAGMITIDNDDRDIKKEKCAQAEGIELVPETASGIEISHFAVNDAYRDSHNNAKGIGEYLYPAFIYPIIKKVSRSIGVKIVYLYAADTSENGDTESGKRLVNYYKDVFGFVEDNSREYRPITPYYDSGCIFMYNII